MPDLSPYDAAESRGKLSDPRLSPAVLTVLAALFLVQAATPLRLDSDATNYLMTAASMADGLGVPDTGFPLGYPYFLSLLDRAGIATAATFVLANCVFVGLGLVAVWHLAARIPFASPRWTVILTMLAAPVVRSIAMPLPEPSFFCASLVALALMSRSREMAQPKRLPLLVSATLLVAVAISLRLSGLALVPPLIFSLFSVPGLSPASITVKWRLLAGLVAALAIALVIALAGFEEARPMMNYLSTARIGYAGGSILTHFLERTVSTLGAVGELTGNVPTSQFDVLKHLYPWIGAVAVTVTLRRGNSGRALNPIGVYLTSYIGLLFLWPHYSTRLWMPVLPLLVAYATAGAHHLASQPAAALALRAYVGWFCVTGLAALAYTTRISLSGERFSERYGTAGGMATPGFEHENPGYNVKAGRLLNRYGVRSQKTAPGVPPGS